MIKDNLQTSTGFKIKVTVWYNYRDVCIGIVSGVSENGEEKSYIGIAPDTEENDDAIWIAENGARFYGDGKPKINQESLEQPKT